MDRARSGFIPCSAPVGAGGKINYTRVAQLLGAPGRPAFGLLGLSRPRAVHFSKKQRTAIAVLL
jgi:hypothetical protein